MSSFLKYALLILIKKGFAITNAFQNILDESGRKHKKIWLHKGILQ